MEESQAPLGVVPVDGRGSLPYALVNGEALVVVASWALDTAGAELYDFDTPFADLRAADRMLVVHDPLCPLTPAEFIAEAVAECERTGAVVVGVRPVTDTVKEYDGSTLGATVDRDTLVSVTSPVVLPAGVLASLDSLDTDDLPALVEQLSARFPVRHLPAPALGRRIGDEADLEVLVALGESTATEPTDSAPVHD